LGYERCVGSEVDNCIQHRQKTKTGAAKVLSSGFTTYNQTLKKRGRKLTIKRDHKSGSQVTSGLAEGYLKEGRLGICLVW